MGLARCGKLIVHINALDVVEVAKVVVVRSGNTEFLTLVHQRNSVHKIYHGCDAACTLVSKSAIVCHTGEEDVVVVVVGEEGVKNLVLLVKQLPLCENISGRAQLTLLCSPFAVASGLQVVELEEGRKLASLCLGMTADLVNIVCPALTYGENVRSLFSTEKLVDVVVQGRAKAVVATLEVLGNLVDYVAS